MASDQEQQIDGNSASGQALPDGRPFPFRLVLPLGQLLLCIALILIVCGPRFFMAFGSQPVSATPAVSAREPDLRPDQDSARHAQRIDLAFHFLCDLNLPGSVVQAPMAAFTKNHPGRIPRSLEIITRSAFGWSVLAMPFWWIAGRGLEALIATRRKLVAPRIHWSEASISYVFLFGGATLASACLSTIASGRGQDGFLMLASCELLWASLGGITVLARKRQREAVRSSAASVT